MQEPADGMHCTGVGQELTYYRIGINRINVHRLYKNCLQFEYASLLLDVYNIPVGQGGRGCTIAGERGLRGREK